MTRASQRFPKRARGVLQPARASAVVEAVGPEALEPEALEVDPAAYLR
jgi:hypothetical protein